MEILLNGLVIRITIKTIRKGGEEAYGEDALGQ